MDQWNLKLDYGFALYKEQIKELAALYPKAGIRLPDKAEIARDMLVDESAVAAREHQGVDADGAETARYLAKVVAPATDPEWVQAMAPGALAALAPGGSAAVDGVIGASAGLVIDGALEDRERRFREEMGYEADPSPSSTTDAVSSNARDGVENNFFSKIITGGGKQFLGKGAVFLGPLASFKPSLLGPLHEDHDDDPQYVKKAPIELVVSDDKK